MSLFTPKAEREAQTKLNIQKGKRQIQRYINNCAATRTKYRGLASRALKLNDENQAQHFANTMIYYEKQENKWNRFLLKIEDIVLRGEAMTAISDAMQSVDQMCQGIKRGISIKNIHKTLQNVEGSMAKVDQAEHVLESVFEDMSLHDNDVGEIPTSALSEQEQEEVAPILDSLRQELQIEEKTGAAAKGAGSKLSTKAQEQIERAKKLRNR